MKSTREKVSYCIGLETGKNLKNQFSDMDVELLLQGFTDALKSFPPKMPSEEVQQVMVALRRQMEHQQRQFFVKMAEENKKAGELFLLENKKKDKIVTQPSGLQYRVIASGNGATPTLFDNVTAHYKGSFIDGQIFENTYESGKPQTFPLNRVIAGWQEALELMKVGDKWELFIPHYLAYGENGFGNVIGPNMTLVFEMELRGINEAVPN